MVKFYIVLRRFDSMTDALVSSIVDTFSGKLPKEIIVFFVSMVPLIELRGAIPIAVGLGLPKLLSFAIAIFGNMLPVPVIFLFARKVLEWGKRLRDIHLTGDIYPFNETPQPDWSQCYPSLQTIEHRPCTSVDIVL